MLVLTVYAPLQIRQQAVERRKYAEALAEVTHQLDMQEPVLLVGDFNGSICPERDFMGEPGARRGCCGLLGRLLGLHGWMSRWLCKGLWPWTGPFSCWIRRGECGRVALT